MVFRVPPTRVCQLLRPQSLALLPFRRPFVSSKSCQQRFFLAPAVASPSPSPSQAAGPRPLVQGSGSGSGSGHVGVRAVSPWSLATYSTYSTYSYSQRRMSTATDPSGHNKAQKPEQQQANSKSEEHRKEKEKEKEDKGEDRERQQHKRGAWETYSHLLETHPILTKALTSAIIVAGGDVLTQNLFTEPGTPFDWRRLCNMGIIGGFLIGPTLHIWYGFLGRMFPAATTQAAVSRLLCDQGIFAPCFVAIFFGAQFALEGRLSELRTHLENSWWEVICTNWTLWIPAQFITFRFIPGKYQVLFANGVALVWNAYLSWAGHEAVHEDSSPSKP